MTYLITYRKNREIHSIEWVAPTGFSRAAVRRSFAQAFPGAELFHIRRQP